MPLESPPTGSQHSSRQFLRAWLSLSCSPAFALCYWYVIWRAEVGSRECSWERALLSPVWVVNVAVIRCRLCPLIWRPWPCEGGPSLPSPVPWGSVVAWGDLCYLLSAAVGTTPKKLGGKAGRDHAGRALLPMPRLLFSFSNGSLGCRKMFRFYFHSEIPRMKSSGTVGQVLSMHSLAWSLGLKLSFQESNGFTVQLKPLPCSAKCTGNLIDSRSSSLISMHELSKGHQLVNSLGYLMYVFQCYRLILHMVRMFGVAASVSSRAVQKSLELHVHPRAV